MKTQQKKILLIIVLVVLASFPWVAPNIWKKFVDALGWLEVFFLMGGPIFLGIFIWLIYLLRKSYKPKQ